MAILDPNDLARADRQVRAKAFVTKGLNALKAARQNTTQLALITPADDEGNLFIGAIIEEIAKQGAELRYFSESIVGKEGATPIAFIGFVVYSANLVLS